MSSERLQAPKGTFDILPSGPSWQQSHLWHFVEREMRAICLEYGCEEIRTPVYEKTDLFCRGVGDSSDIVTKEMFTFDDRSGRSMSLRPEGTAAVARAFLEANLQQERSLHKLYYIAPMFRYERPQSGRYRQHHQFGVEIIGSPSFQADVEAIDLLFSLYTRLGLKGLKVHLNTVGDSETRKNYREALLAFLAPHAENLSAESRVRLAKNPLRILDSKDAGDRKILEGVPSILHSLSPSSKRHFEEVQNLLTKIGIPFVIDDQIVRGLDYYQETVFEILSDNLGAKNTVGAGGRYDGLFQTLGGPALPGVGFATGIERLLQTLFGQQVPLPSPPAPLAVIIGLGAAAKERAFLLGAKLRRLHFPIEVELDDRKLSTTLQHAVKRGAMFAAILGDEELKSNKIQLKHLLQRMQEEVSLDDLPSLFAAARRNL